MKHDLLKAAQLIREKGLQKGQLHGRDGYCLLGAIGTAVCGSKFDFDDTRCPARPAVNFVTRYLQDMTKTLTLIPHWNDAPERTAQEVINLLERAAGAAACL
jgi:hypothetical protein